jgi:hypothetical protein
MSEQALEPTAPPEGTWLPLAQQREAQWRAFPFRRPENTTLHLGALWRSSEVVVPGEPFQLRVRVQPGTHARDFSIQLVGFDGAFGRTVHTQKVLMYTEQELRAGEVRGFPLERVTLPPDIGGKNPAHYWWYLKIESQLGGNERFQKWLALLVRSRPTAPPVPPCPEVRASRTPFPVSADLRRQLEGGIEVLEAALGRYALLEKALRRRQWAPLLQARLEPLREVVRDEPAIVEALTHLHQRLEGEGASGGMEPALELARKIERLRTRLEVLTDRLLDSGDSQRMTGEARLAENLARLGQNLIPPAVSREEKVLHWGRYLPDAKVEALAVLFAMLWLFSPSRWVLLWMVLPLLWLLSQYLRSGWFWLTPRRLVWKPTGRKPIHIPLHAIPARKGVQRVSPTRVRVRMVDGRHYQLESIKGADRLVTLLNQLPRPSGQS